MIQKKSKLSQKEVQEVDAAVTFYDPRHLPVQKMLDKAGRSLNAKELLEIVDQASWQPMTTAPKDGRIILVWVRSQNIIERVVWEKTPYRKTGGMWSVVNYRSKKPPYGYYFDGCYALTHWMPLPKGPEPQAGRRKSKREPHE